MAPMILKTFLSLGFPLVVLPGDDKVLSRAGGRAAAIDHLTQGKQGEPKPLNLRWFGYDTNAAKGYWDWLTCVERQAEKTFLTKDVLFPFVYGGALAASLWWVWATVGRPFNPAWIVAPLAMILTADWIEHLIQLAQLRHYVLSNEGRMHNFWIQVSSGTTTITLWLTLGLYVSLAGLVLSMMVSLSDRRLTTHAPG